jgi:hypothetical protein
MDERKVDAKAIFNDADADERFMGAVESSGWWYIS